LRFDDAMLKKVVGFVSLWTRCRVNS